MNLGKAIKTIRKQLKVTQTELSEKTGLSQTSLSKIETGTKPSDETLKKISTALNVPLSIIYVLGMDSSDVPDTKKEKFELLFPAIKSLAYKIVDMDDAEK